jgi:hypothetical protein
VVHEPEGDDGQARIGIEHDLEPIRQRVPLVTRAQRDA